MTDLRTHKHGYSLLNQLFLLQREPEVNSLGRLFGVSPLYKESASWYKGLLGEIEVGKILNSLKGEGYTVLHSVPVGQKGSDIDHVVISPTGVIYTINTKHCSGKKVWSGSYVLVNGQKTDYTRNSLYEADRVRKFFTYSKQTREVIPLLVFVKASAVISKADAKVSALESNNLIKVIKSSEKDRIKKNLVSERLPENVFNPDFWSKGYVDESSSQEIKWKWFKSLDKEVKTAATRRMLWSLVGVSMIVAVIFVFVL